MEIKWKEVNTDEDINFVLNYFGYFHDACLKEAKYLSGSYVGESFSMKPIDGLKQMYVIIQRQNKNHSVIELLFEGIERLNLVPATEDYDSIINGILLERKDKYIYFANYADYEVKIDDLEKYSSEITWIKAKSLKWRETNQYIGSSIVYVHRDI